MKFEVSDLDSVHINAGFDNLFSFLQMITGYLMQLIDLIFLCKSLFGKIYIKKEGRGKNVLLSEYLRVNGIGGQRSILSLVHKCIISMNSIFFIYNI